jgi:translation elongation factor EF-4
MRDLELEILKGILRQLEAQRGISSEDRQLAELRAQVQALELTRRFKDAQAKVTYSRVVSLALAAIAGLVLIVAALLGVDVSGVFR